MMKNCPVSIILKTGFYLFWKGRQMTQPLENVIWTRPEWVDRAHAWIDRSLDAAGITRSGPFEQFHVTLWSTLMRVPTDAGLLYFKACEPDTEPRLTVALRAVQPENLPDVVAVELDEGWMLTRDAGQMLRERLKSPADLAMIEPALVQYANLQMAVVDRREQFFQMGALDRRLERLPGMFAEMLADLPVLRIGAEDGLTPAQHEELLALQPRYAEMCRALQAESVPETLHHDDFHAGNIFVSPKPGAAGGFRFVFSDWGESCVAHPFFSIMLCLRNVGWRAGLPDEATEAPDRMPPELNRLRDVYLARWQDYAPAGRLVEIFNLAWRVGMVSRALTWREYVKTLEGPALEGLTHFVPAWLQEFLLAMK